ncbi:YtxH domain-containing protein [Emticicia sp. 21SJ11W-3]|uniref:YtxH domain-containing protein n=1 Tax=Emticicia sp. 21SJ11W-3 TaxID=2916755 RepID=UPI00209DC3B2|nr:YtxH domain-containing protein [Emticicia sp. 21SJ11W-3]UTA66893.1 YtxH domain-containing protein [Emticicia sp. 21SJ11W-3]
MNSGKLLAGMLAGFAVGALIGVLFAPEKGSDSRKKILRKGEELAGDLKDKLDDFVEAFNKNYQHIAQKTDSTKEDKMVETPEVKIESAGNTDAKN